MADYLGEYDSIERLNAIADSLDLIESEGDIDKLYAYLEANGCDIMDAIENIDDCTFYPGYSLEDVAEELVAECYDLPEFALMYFDYAAFARDLGVEGYYEATTGVITR